MSPIKMVAVACAAFAWDEVAGCNITFNVTLETFGEGVRVELRTGSPGNSRVVQSVRSAGGQVLFDDLCPGQYFMAIGNDETVSVTPVRTFVDGATYSSRLTVQRGSGNVSKKSRKAL